MQRFERSVQVISPLHSRISLAPEIRAAISIHKFMSVLIDSVVVLDGDGAVEFDDCCVMPLVQMKYQKSFLSVSLLLESSKNAHGGTGDFEAGKHPKSEFRASIGMRMYTQAHGVGE